MTSTSVQKATTRHVWQWNSQRSGLVLITKNDQGRVVVERNVGCLDELPAVDASKEADLLDIATAVYGTDKLAPRPPAGAGLGEDAHYLEWRRKLHVTIPVRDANYWNSELRRSAIERTLDMLTADVWQLEFVTALPPRRPARQMPLRPPTSRPVALFSGGLDSLSGTLLHAKQHGQIPWLVSVASNSHMTSQQQGVYRALAAYTGEADVLLPFSACCANVKLTRLAKKQRARSFLYFCIAALVARRIGTSSILVFENGVTSLNVPISSFLTSTRTTRTTHPLVLLEFERMVRTVFDWAAFSVELPYLYYTKAEMVGAIADVKEIVAKTVSCARVRTDRWCGTCTACLLRRQVLWSAGLESIDRDERVMYTEDIFASFAHQSELKGRNWYFLATVDHVSRILTDRSALAREPLLVRSAAALAERHGTTFAAEFRKIIDLHVRYAREWVLALAKCREDYSQLAFLSDNLTAVDKELN
jgi:Queuosine biosynthesis protein QueC